MHKDLIVAIFVPTTGEGKMPGRVGTGYPVTEDLILTSRHVIEPENRDRQKPIRVRWFHDKPADGKPPEWTPLDDHRNGDILVWIGKGDLDAALLRCRRPEYLHKFPVKLPTERKPRDGERWQSAGFARANRRGDVREPGQFGGTLREMAEGASFFEVVEDVQPIAEEQWQGVSGMPVFAGSELLGVVKCVPPNYDHKKLEAVPVWRLFQDEGFKKALGIDEQRERLERARRLLRQPLERSDAATSDFAAELGLPSGDIPQCREQVVERLLVDKLSPERMFDLALSVRDKRRGKKDWVGAHVAQELVLAILPAIHDAAVVSNVRRDKSDSAICPLLLPTKLRTLAEIIMAAADRRAASLRPPKSRQADPEGVASLPEPPESGRDPDGKQFSRDWRTHLLETFDTDPDRFENTFKNYLKERFIPGHLRSPGAGVSEQELLDTIAAQLRLEAEASEGGLTYYYIAAMPDNAEARQKKETVLAQLKRAFPHIAFLRLAGTDPLNVEWERYSKLRDLLYQDPEVDQ